MYRILVDIKYLGDAASSLLDKVSREEKTLPYEP